MLERLKFRVIAATSEEPGFSCTELERHGPLQVGWHSARSTSPAPPNYQHELILQLESRSRLGHIQILGHQYLIPERIEFYIGESFDENCDPTRDFPASATTRTSDLENSIHFILLGHIKMSTNQSTGFKARELKSITVECKGTYVKIVMQPNYYNKYNRHHQVALVAINLLGDKLDDDEEMTRSSSFITFEETSQSDRDKSLFSPFDDLAFTMYVDVEVQQIVRKMDTKKQEAVLDERFDYASKLKHTIDQLRKAGELLAKYQLEKQIAASREDFQKAKDKKLQMDTYRDTLYKSLRVKELLEPNGRLEENDEPGKIIGVNMTRSVTELSIPPQVPISAASTPESTTSDRFSSRLTTPDNEKKESGYYSNESNEPKFPPVFVKKRRPVSVDKETKEPKEEKPPPPAPPKPSNMSERARRYAALPILMFGEGLVEKFFSKNFAVKEDGLRCLQKILSDYRRVDKSKSDPPSKVFRAASLLLQRTIKDTIFSVFNQTIQVLIILLDDFSKKHRLASSELSQGLERILPELLSKSGDIALGKNKVAIDCIMRLQTSQHIRALNVISSNLTKPFDTPVHPRLAQSKSEMVCSLLTTYGLSTDKNSGMTPRDYVEFAVSALNQPSESTRRNAEKLLVTLYHTHPKLVRQYLPLEEDVSPKNVQYRQLFQNFDKIDKERKDGTATLNSIMKDLKGNGITTGQMTSSIYIPKM